MEIVEKEEVSADILRAELETLRKENERLLADLRKQQLQIEKSKLVVDILNQYFHRDQGLKDHLQDLPKEASNIKFIYEYMNEISPIVGSEFIKNYLALLVEEVIDSSFQYELKRRIKNTTWKSDSVFHYLKMKLSTI